MVHLGVCDEPIKSSCVSNFTDSQLGGTPHWLSDNLSIPVCKLCGNPTFLVTQLYAPLFGSPYHRVLYLFACVEGRCQNKSEAWCTVRSLRKESKESVSVAKDCRENELVSGDDWGVDGDDWGGGSGEKILDALEGTTSAAEITKSMNHLQVEESSHFDPCVGHVDKTSDQYLSSFYLYVMEEPDGDIRNSVSKDYELEDIADGEGGGGGGGGKEKYEKSEVKDREFYKFYKKIKRCPEQCIRYDLGGTPLLQPPDLNIPSCPLCNSPRQFEFQIMPALISILRFPRFKGTESSKSLDYRTVLVYTCQRDCVVSCGSEYVVCVPEPDVVIPTQEAGENSRSGS